MDKLEIQLNQPVKPNKPGRPREKPGSVPGFPLAYHQFPKKEFAMGWETYDEDMREEAEKNPQECSCCGNYMTWTIWGWRCNCSLKKNDDHEIDDKDPCRNCHPATEFACIGCPENR